MKMHISHDLFFCIVGSKINTGTFTRPKKTKPSPMQTSMSDETKENSEAVHHQNVADIENLAKMQEESLRQSIAQTSPRRGRSSIEYVDSFLY